MLSIISTGCAALFACGYAKNANNLHYLQSAKPLCASSTFGDPQYITGSLDINEPLICSTMFFHIHEKIRKDIFLNLYRKEIHKLINHHENSDMQSINIINSDKVSVDITGLIPLIHSKFGKKISEKFVPFGPYTRKLTNINIGGLAFTYRKILLGTKRVNYGLKSDDMYTIVGNYNGKEFIGNPIISENIDIQDMIKDKEVVADMYFGMTLVMSAIALGTLIL